MMTTSIQGVDQKALELVQEDNPEAFNNYIQGLGRPVNLQKAQFRGYDLRKYNLKTADLTGAYLRHADLRGLDLSQAKLDGVSLKEAKMSGVLFPKNLLAEEIRLSFEQGTRLRCS